MLEPLELLPILLAPVAALLFLDLLRSRRLRYPHDLLEPADRRGPASLFFRSLRRRYDVAIDAAIAIALAFALPASHYGPARAEGAARGRKPAVVIDCSRSMLAGERGSRPFDIAMRRAAEDPSLEGADAFALAFDPERVSTRLVPISHIAKSAPEDLVAATDALEAELTFFAVDYDAMADLRRRGYGRITLLTDSLGRDAEGFTAVESGFAVSFAAFPSAARYDRASESWIVALAESGPRGAMNVYAWDEDRGRFSRLASTRYAVDDSPGGRSVRFAESGLYLVSLKDPTGGPGIDIPLRFRPRVLPAAAAGPFSERMASVFPFLERSPRPFITFRDADTPSPPDRGVAATIVTAILPSEGSLILDPALSAGRPIAAAYEKGSDFALGPASIANEDLPLAYDSAIAAISPPAFLSAVPHGARSLLRAGSAFLARTAMGLEPIATPASEFFEPRGGAPIYLPPISPKRLAWALILAALAASKLLARWLLRRRSDSTRVS